MLSLYSIESATALSDVCIGPPKSLNDTLVVDSPFQTLAVDLLSNL